MLQRVAWNRKLVYSMQHGAHNMLCAAMLHRVWWPLLQVINMTDEIKDVWSVLIYSNTLL